jgi:hypothetical protein
MPAHRGVRATGRQGWAARGGRSVMIPARASTAASSSFSSSSPSSSSADTCPARALVGRPPGARGCGEGSRRLVRDWRWEGALSLYPGAGGVNAGGGSRGGVLYPGVGGVGADEAIDGVRVVERELEALLLLTCRPRPRARARAAAQRPSRSLSSSRAHRRAVRAWDRWAAPARPRAADNSRPLPWGVSSLNKRAAPGAGGTPW